MAEAYFLRTGGSQSLDRFADPKTTQRAGRCKGNRAANAPRVANENSRLLQRIYCSTFLAARFLQRHSCRAFLGEFLFARMATSLPMRSRVSCGAFPACGDHGYFTSFGEPPSHSFGSNARTVLIKYQNPRRSLAVPCAPPLLLALHPRSFLNLTSSSSARAWCIAPAAMAKKKTLKRFACDLCGMKFEREGHVRAHRNKMWCVKRRRGNHGDHKRIDNLKRALVQNIPDIIRHLKNVVVKQGATGAGYVTFIPFGAPNVVTLDCGTMKELYDAIVADKGGGHVVAPASLFATAAAYSMLWTTCFARTCGLVPVPYTRCYERGLEKRLMRGWRNNEQVCNVKIQCCSGMSFRGKTDAFAAQDKIHAIIRHVRKLAVNAPSAVSDVTRAKGWSHMEYTGTHDVMPEGSYRAKYIRMLLQGTPVQPTGCHSEHEDDYHIASNSKLALCKLFNENPHQHIVVYQYRLLLLDAEVKKMWTKYGQRKVARPDYNVHNLQACLCQWKAGGFKDEVTDYKHTMQACVGIENFL